MSPEMERRIITNSLLNFLNTLGTGGSEILLTNHFLKRNAEPGYCFSISQDRFHYTQRSVSQRLDLLYDLRSGTLRVNGIDCYDSFLTRFKTLFHSLEKELRAKKAQVVYIQPN